MLRYYQLIYELKLTNKHFCTYAQHKYINWDHFVRGRLKKLKHMNFENEGEVMCMGWEDYANNPLWPILVEAVHTMVMYTHHKAYVRDVVLVEQPNISVKDLALRLSISLGESMVILYELQKVKK